MTSHHEDDEPLFKDIVVSYQPYQPPSVNSGDVVTAGFVPHWFREELTNTGEVSKASKIDIVTYIYLLFFKSTKNN
jgi:hypothetical protein